ncbi:MAG: hypothetical protein LBT84_03570, partial [Spirochaetia bacterium]|nr:hypothetical protein [Spirochaetia bacterium]
MKMNKNRTAAKVFMTRDISPAGLAAVYKALGRELPGKVAVKISTANTAYAGKRLDTAMHKQAAKDHGFTAIALLDILDEAGSSVLP